MSGSLKFETAVTQLEKIVRDLEGGNLTLEESLKAFEEGMGLVRACEKILQAAKGKVEKLIQKEGKLETEPYEP